MRAEGTAGKARIENRALLLRLGEELFGDGYLRRAAVVAEDEPALMLIGEHGVTARAVVRGHSLRLREVCAGRNAARLFAVGGVVMAGKVECYEADLRATILGLNSDDVHVAG